jgi:aryl-alcohol dehydrogenase-like predicted oxidoreductase
LAQGLLVNKEPVAYLGYSQEALATALQTIDGIDGNERKRIEIALKFVLAHPAISSSVAGIRNIDQLDSLLAAYEKPAMNPTQVSRLKTDIQRHEYTQHR